MAKITAKIVDQKVSVGKTRVHFLRTLSRTHGLETRTRGI